MYKVIVVSEAQDDLDKLPDDVLLEVLDYFSKYETDPYKYSSKLYNQGSLNLEGYRKTYVANAAYRIVLKVEEGVAKIVEVVAVGERQNRAVYENAHIRIAKKES